MIIVICLLFAACGAEQENTDVVQDEMTADDPAVEPAEENVLDGKETAQTDTLYLCKGSARLTEMVEKQSKVLEGYASFLQECEWQGQGNGGGQEPRFALLYLDDDDVPELVVMVGNAHAQGASVYMFQDGEVFSIGSYGQYGAMLYREKEGLLFHDYDTQGNVHSWVYQIEEDHVALLQSYDYSAGIQEEDKSAYWVDGKEVSEKRYREVADKWGADGYQIIQYDDCRTLTESDIRKGLQEELEDRILMQEKVLKQNLLIAAGAQESDVLLFDYDDYDGDGKYEAFMIAGNTFDDYGTEKYDGKLYFAGADRGVSALDVDHDLYRMIDGVMDFGSRKYLFFYLDYNLTANISVIWTVEDGEPVEISESLQRGQVVYRESYPKDEFEIWIDAYDNYCEKDYFGKDDHMWTGHTWKPYFYHYNYSDDRLEPYAGEEITPEAFKELSKTNIIEEIKAEGYTVGEIIRWDNDVVTINYHYVELWGEDESQETYVYENVIWDNRVRDYWRKDERGVTSWKNAGEGGIYWL